MIINIEQVAVASNSKYFFYFREEGNPKVIAYAINDGGEYDKYLYFNDKEYCFADKRSFCEISDLPELKWEIRSKSKKSICQKIYENGEYITHHYGVGLTPLKAKWKYAFGANVYEYMGKHYTVFTTGFADEASHFYSIFDDAFRCVGIIERHYGYKIRSSIYIEDEEYLLISLLVCMEETICALIPASNREYRHDSSAGNYISIYKDEKELLDRDFIKRAKMQQELVSDCNWLSDKVRVYDDEILERSECLQEIGEKTDKATIPKFALFCILFLVLSIVSVFIPLPMPIISIVLIVLFLIL